jgi:hypothetical protein
LATVFAANRGADMGTMMDAFIAAGPSRAQIEKFLEADLDGTGSVRDHIAADMTNQLLGALGQRNRQTPQTVRRLRERGTWTTFDRRPRE